MKKQDKKKRKIKDEEYVKAFGTKAKHKVDKKKKGKKIKQEETGETK